MKNIMNCPGILLPLSYSNLQLTASRELVRSSLILVAASNCIKSSSKSFLQDNKQITCTLLLWSMVEKGCKETISDETQNIKMLAYMKMSSDVPPQSSTQRRLVRFFILHTWNLI